MSKSRIGKQNPNKGKDLPENWVNNLKGKRVNNKKYFRECPNCNDLIGYSNIYLMSNAEKEKTLCRSCFQKGRIMSDNTKVKMKIASKGRNSVKVLQFTLDDEFILEWNSMIEAEIILKVTGIGRVCNGIRKTCGGFKWQFKNE
jgi:late competence protein required for DNA uptake (superfamily II DNA/RNA helicase)